MSFISDRWYKKPDNEIVNDVYGNRIYWGVLKILKSRGYYNNRKKKGASTNGTYHTYGEEYSVEAYSAGNHADPNKYEDKI